MDVARPDRRAAPAGVRGRLTQPDVTEALIVNWARWVQARDFYADELSVSWSPEEGRYAPADRSEAYGVPAGGGAAPDELAALRVERVMVVLRAERPDLYRVLWQGFVRRRDDITAAATLRISLTSYQDAVVLAVAWVRRGLRLAGAEG